MGDSITYGQGANHKTESYPVQLQALLGEDYAVKNFGIGGATLIHQGKPNVWQELPGAKAFQPHFIIVDFGINDTRSQGVTYWSHFDEFPDAMRELLKELTALPTGPRVLVCAPTALQTNMPNLAPGRAEINGERLPRLEQIREVIRKVAKEFATNNVGIVELGGITQKKPELYTPDGVHMKKEGYALMAKTFLPLVQRQVPKPFGGSIAWGPRRTLEEIEKYYAEIPKVTFQPEASRWAHLPKTMEKLRAGKKLRVVMLGDSIINDTARSDWERLVEREYPGAKIEKIVSVRGSTGCWFYREPPRVEVFVTDHQPDLVIIGGISQHDDIEAIRDVIGQIRAKCDAEILLMSGPFGPRDPQEAAYWQEIQQPKADSYRAMLPQLAAELGAEYFDMQKAWAEYIRASGRETKSFKRDVYHANPQGEQILARILERYFAKK